MLMVRFKTRANYDRPIMLRRIVAQDVGTRISLTDETAGPMLAAIKNALP
jgi:hypothetical protein